MSESDDEEKTKAMNAKQGSFGFLGFNIEVNKSTRTGKYFPLIRPSMKSVKRIKAEIKGLTCRKNLALPKEEVVFKLNAIVRGWTNYFYYGNCSKELSKLKRYLEERVQAFLRHKHRIKNRGYKTFPSNYLHDILKLYKIPTTAPWTRAVKAYGRR